MIPSKEAFSRKYFLLYLIYLAASVLMLVTVFVLVIVYYATQLRDVVTVSHLFLFLFLLLFAFYLRMNALHYQKLDVLDQMQQGGKEAKNKQRVSAFEERKKALVGGSPREMAKASKKGSSAKRAKLRR